MVGTGYKACGLVGILASLAAWPALAEPVAQWQGGALEDASYRACLTLTRRQPGADAAGDCALEQWLAAREAQACAGAPGLDDLVLRKRVTLMTPRVREQMVREVKVSEAEVQACVAERLARYNVPSRVFFTDQPLPRTASGKILKRELKQQYGQ